VRKGLFCSVGIAVCAVQFSFGQKYETLGVGSCVTGDCHASENNWYKNDPHKNTLRTIDDNLETSNGYARAVGIQSKDLYKTGNLCMECHATSTSRSKEAEDGVSCESCHGAGGGYKEPHQDGKGGGPGRPGYVKGVASGMADFRKNKQLVANTCVGCHYITNDALRTAGHKSGDDFKYQAKIAKVAGYPNHWKREPGEDDKVKARFENAKKAKGPLAVVLPTASRTVQQPSVAQTGDSPSTRPPSPPRPVTANRVTTPVNIGPVALPPFPAVTDSTRLDSLLLFLKLRLELLYEKTK